MKQYTQEQIAFVNWTIENGGWVSWDQVTDAFPELAEEFLGKTYVPLFAFNIPPTFPVGVLQTAINCTFRLPSGYQDVVMSRPLNPAHYDQTHGFVMAIQKALVGIGEYHAVSSYVKAGR
jgi:hypothetical protein